MSPLPHAPRVEDAPGYEHGHEHLADLAILVALRFERLSKLRRRLPNRPLVTDDDRRAVIAGVPEIAALDRRIAETAAAIDARAAFSRRLGVALPLEILRERFGLTAADLAIVATLATIERGAAFNPYATRTDKDEPLQADVAFLAALLAGGAGRAAADGGPAGHRTARAADAAGISEDLRLRFGPDAPLVAGELIHLAAGPGWVPDAPLVYKRLRLDDRILDFIEGIAAPAPSLLGAAGRFVPAPAPTNELLLDRPEIVEGLARALARNDQIVLVAGARGVGRKSVVGAAARSLGRPMLVIDVAALPSDPGALARELAPLVREARLQDAILVIDSAQDAGDGEAPGGASPTSTSHPLVSQLRRVHGPLVVVAEQAPVWSARIGRAVVRFDLPFPSADIQRRLWVRHLPPGLRLAGDTSLATIVKRYSASCAAIRDACDELGRLDAVHQRAGVITEAHLVEVVRGRLSHRLGPLAGAVRTTLDWSDVVLPEDVLATVFELLNYAAHRQRVFREWGFARKLPYGRGLSALFSGPPGTGKTMICSLLAKELGLELFRIDLSQVVNKYIGETEKNLGRVFDEAARGQVMLLFDEADALFAKRTEVKSSNDRYGNLEINFLLQRMEAHEGVVVLTTNSENALDPAFRRRIRFRVRFPAPDEQQRLLLWEGMMPREAQVGDDLDLRVLARRFPLAGGNIMNALVRAATAAAADGTSIQQQHLLRAAELEYAEMGHLA